MMIAEKFKKRNIRNLGDRKGFLVLCVDRSDRIIQFNKECEKITGYNRDEVLNRKISDFLIPNDHTGQWKKLFDSLKQNVWIDNFKIPLKTQSENEILVSWGSFPIEDNGSVRNVCFIGENLTKDDHTKKQSFKTSEKSENIQHKQKDSVIDQNNMVQPRNKSEDRIIFRKKVSTKSNRTFKPTKNNVLPEIKKHVEGKSLKSDKINEMIKNISKNYEKPNKKLKDLEKKDRKLERKNRTLEKKLKSIRAHMQKSNTIRLGKELKHEETTSQKTGIKVLSKKLSFLKDLFGVKRKQEEFKNRMYILDEHKKEIDELEAQLIKDRKNLDKKIAEFSSWNEKLLNLESEIEKKRAYLVEQEKTFIESHTSSPVGKIDLGASPPETESVLAPGENVDQDVHHDILDKIPECAAIVQRGVLKQVNSSFAGLIGYDIEKIAEKSFFDFIALEGLAGIKKYYLNRLRGGSISAYETVFSTKDNKKMTVRVSIKPTTYNGEKAEIAVVKEVEDQQEDVSTTSKAEEMQEDSTVEKEDKQENVSTEKVEEKPEEATTGDTKKARIDKCNDKKNER